MNTQELLAGIEEEIARLQQVRTLLGAGGGAHPAAFSARKWHKKKRVMSAEARKRIGDAQRKRWAKQKKAAK